MKRATFYSPMAEPDQNAASGTERMCALLQQALTLAGFDVARPRLPRAYEGRGKPEAQAALRDECQRAAQAYLNSVWAGDAARPDLWFSYHVYYKSPDWIGPAVSKMLGIPYVVAEGSHAMKRAGGPWALGHDGSAAALTVADRLFAMTQFDRFCLDPLAPGRVRDLKPFIDVKRLKLAASHGERQPVEICTVGMMRNERKRASYALLAQALTLLGNLPLKLTIAGDGPFRAEIEAMFAPAASGHEIRFLGAVGPGRVATLLADSDIFAWPGLGEAYGLVFLEAQGAGLPVVACRDRGVPDATREGETTLLSAPGDAAAYAANLRRLIGSADLREEMGAAAAKFVHEERSVEAAAATLRHVFAGIGL
jgi:glycosyltransferase involved in cell wall biosynthesis